MATDTFGAPNGASSLTGLGVNYNLSKTTMVYGRYQKASNVVALVGTASATAVNSAYGAQTITAAGLLVKF